MSTQFERLVELSPYPVKIEYVGGYDGGFWYGSGSGHKPYEEKDFHPHIGINPNLVSRLHRTATLIHEIGHAIHYKRRCRCYVDYNPDKYLVEYHAERFTLRFMLRYKLIGVLRYEMNYLDRNFHRFPSHGQKMITRLRQEKIWMKCLEYLEIR